MFYTYYIYAEARYQTFSLISSYFISPVCGPLKKIAIFLSNLFDIYGQKLYFCQL